MFGTHRNTQLTQVSFDSPSERLINPLPGNKLHGTSALFTFDTCIMNRQTLFIVYSHVSNSSHESVTMKATVLVIQKSDKTTPPWTATLKKCLFFNIRNRIVELFIGD